MEMQVPFWVLQEAVGANERRASGRDPERGLRMNEEEEGRRRRKSKKKKKKKK